MYKRQGIGRCRIDAKFGEVWSYTVSNDSNFYYIQRKGKILKLPKGKYIHYNFDLDKITFDIQAPSLNSLTSISRPYNSECRYIKLGYAPYWRRVKKMFWYGDFGWEQHFSIYDSNGSFFNKSLARFRIVNNNLYFIECNNSWFRDAVYPVTFSFHSYVINSSGGNATWSDGTHHHTMEENDKIKLNDMLLYEDINVIYFDDFEDGNLDEYYFEGDANWSINSSYSYSGTYSAKSDDISDSQYASILKNFSFSNNVTVSYCIMIDSEDYYDYVEFRVNGSMKADSKDQRGFVWHCNAVTLEAGDYTLEWRYKKDASGSEGSDSGFLDYILIYEPPLKDEGWVLMPAVPIGNSYYTEWHMRNKTLKPFTQTVNGREVKWVLGTGKIESDMEAGIRLDKTGIRNISFWWAASAETNYDGCIFRINDAQNASLLGDYDWQSYSLTNVNANNYTWSMKKDASVSYYNDTCWVAAISYDEYDSAGNYTTAVLDAGSGNSIKNVTVTFTSNGGRVDLWSNCSGSWTEHYTNITSGTNYDISGSEQYCSIRLELSTTNTSLTPEVSKIEVWFASSGADTTPPTISNEAINDTVIYINESIYLNCSVTDNTAVDTVKFYIEPFGNLTANNINSEYYILCNATNPCNTTQEGQYNWTSIWANDTSNNVNTTTVTLSYTVTSTTTTTTIIPKNPIENIINLLRRRR